MLAQTYKDLELLLIDDGSKDSSGAICDEYAARDSRVKVFHKENGGVSSARNVGLDNAQGEWVTFVDSDDYIEENFLKSFEGNLDADMLVGNMVEVGLTGNLLTNIPSGYYCPIQTILSGNLNQLAFMASWGKLYRRDLLSNIRFDIKMTIGEDHYFVLLFCCHAKDILIINSKNSSVCAFSSYVYYPPEDMNSKYQISVHSAIYHLKMMEKVYRLLGVFDKSYELYKISRCYERCSKDMLKHSELWFKDKEVMKYSLRRSAHLGILQWVRTWLSFHGFYRLKLFMAKRFVKRWDRYQ